MTLTCISVSVHAMVSRANDMIRLLFEAEKALVALQSHHSSLTVDYFEFQWARQKELQSDVISETARQKKEQITLLLGVEEQLIEAR